MERPHVNEGLLHTPGAGIVTAPISPDDFAAVQSGSVIDHPSVTAALMGNNRTLKNDVRGHPYFRNMDWRKLEQLELEPPLLSVINTIIASGSDRADISDGFNITTPGANANDFVVFQPSQGSSPLPPWRGPSPAEPNESMCMQSMSRAPVFNSNHFPLRLPTNEKDNLEAVLDICNRSEWLHPLPRVENNSNCSKENTRKDAMTFRPLRYLASNSNKVAPDSTPQSSSSTSYFEDWHYVSPAIIVEESVSHQTSVKATTAL